MTLGPTVVLSNNTYNVNYNNNVITYSFNWIFPIFQLDFYIYGPIFTWVFDENILYC